MKFEKPLICPDCGAKHFHYNLTMVENGIRCWRCWCNFDGSQSRIYVGINDGWLEDLLLATEEMKKKQKRRKNPEFEIERAFIDNLIFFLLKIRRQQINERAGL